MFENILSASRGAFLRRHVRRAPPDRRTDAGRHGPGHAARVAVGLGLALGAVLVCSAAGEQRDVDGLVRVEGHGVDHLFVLPEADFASYKQVHLEPVDVSFSERWTSGPRRRSAATRRLSARDIESIKSAVASEFERTVARVLMMGGYTLVDHDGEGVLRVTPRIVNLYIAAPSQAARGNSRVFVANTGHMTLVADVRDSVTGEILAHIIDTQQGRRTGRLELATSVSNMADARRAFTTWATVLRTGLDEARKYPIGSAPEKQASKESTGTPR